jgi:BMFP domain-containing protein YqiC
MTLAFTKQMPRVFDLVELEEFDHLVAMLDRRFLEARKRIAFIFATCSEYEQAQANKHIQL